MNLSESKDASVMSVQDLLTRQLEYIQKHRISLLNGQYPLGHPYRKRAEQVLTVYGLFLNKMIDEEDFRSVSEIVLIGSEIHLECKLFHKTGKTATMLTFPHVADEAEGRTSFLSPVGIQALLSTRGDQLTIDMADSVYRAKLTDIHFSADAAVLGIT